MGPRPAGKPGTVTDITGAIDLRRQRSRRRLRVLTICLTALAVVLAVLVWVVRSSSLLDVREVEVVGVSTLEAGQVRDAAKVPVGRPLAAVDLSQVCDRVTALPPVKDVTVTRSWPHTVRIEVTERPLVYHLRGRGGYLWVDREGVVFHRTTTRHGRTPWALTRSNDRRVLTDVATVVASLEPGVVSQLDHLEATGPDSITLVLTKGRRVVWGSADRSPLKSQVTSAIIKVKGTVYDVSSPEHPTAR